MRYVVEYVDGVGNSCAAYFGDKQAAEEFIAALQGNAQSFYLEEIAVKSDIYSVLRRVEDFAIPA